MAPNLSVGTDRPTSIASGLPLTAMAPPTWAETSGSDRNRSFTRKYPWGPTLTVGSSSQRRTGLRSNSKDRIPYSFQLPMAEPAIFRERAHGVHRARTNERVTVLSWPDHRKPTKRQTPTAGTVGSIDNQSQRDRLLQTQTRHRLGHTHRRARGPHPNQPSRHALARRDHPKERWTASDRLPGRLVHVWFMGGWLRREFCGHVRQECFTGALGGIELRCRRLRPCRRRAASSGAVLDFSPSYVIVVVFAGNDFRDTYLGIDKESIVDGAAELQDTKVRALVPAEALVNDTTVSAPCAFAPRPQRWLQGLSSFRFQCKDGSG